ncbi:MAG TPA: type II toxin-antitoxin system PemK/MazF family toxin [Candidatus Norongarragalinales archaeon]|jgi:mRNA interferase MazF|nr:type II toxin-antitoxin system PemK/MazF family toxin [Candidatus Norongarragalinales archaeon]
MDVKRGDVWLVSLDPTIGHEIKKSRPAVIIQNDLGNKFSPITIIAPVTSQNIENVYPFEVFLSSKRTGLEKDSKVLLNQIRAVDKRRLVKRLGRLDDEALERVDESIRISLGLEKL